MTKKDRNNQIDFVELPAPSVARLERAKTFYSRVFGWTYESWGDDYADIKGSGLASGLNADASHKAKHPLVVVYTSDLEAAHERVRAAKGKITRDIFSFSGGRRFHFEDPAGNELAVWSDVDD